MCNKMVESKYSKLTDLCHNGVPAGLCYRCRGNVDLQPNLTDQDFEDSAITNNKFCEQNPTFVFKQIIESIIKTTYPDNETFLCSASQIELEDFLIKLLSSGADTGALNYRGEGLCAIAAKYNHLDILKLLVAHGCDPNNDPTQTPLSIAAEKGYIDMAKYLIELGVDVNTVSSSGNAPLHDAIYGGNTEIAELLINAEADVNKYSKDGYYTSPLILAVLHNQVHLVKHLIVKGASIMATDIFSKNPIMYAQAHKNEELVNLFINLIHQRGKVYWIFYELEQLNERLSKLNQHTEDIEATYREQLIYSNMKGILICRDAWFRNLTDNTLVDLPKEDY